MFVAGVLAVQELNMCLLVRYLGRSRGMTDRPEWMLTDDQIEEAQNEGLTESPIVRAVLEMHRRIAKAQARALLKWGQRKCLEHTFPPYPTRFNCSKCLGQVQQEVSNG